MIKIVKTSLLFWIILTSFFAISVINSYLILRLCWRAYFEGNGFIIVSFNAFGEMFFELNLYIFGFIFVILSIIYLSKRLL